MTNDVAIAGSKPRDGSHGQQLVEFWVVRVSMMPTPIPVRGPGSPVYPFWFSICEKSSFGWTIASHARRTFCWPACCLTRAVLLVLSYFCVHAPIIIPILQMFGSFLDRPRSVSMLCNTESSFLWPTTVATVERGQEELCGLDGKMQRYVECKRVSAVLRTKVRTEPRFVGGHF